MIHLEKYSHRRNKGPIEQLSKCEVVFRRWLGDSWCCHCVGRQVGTCPSCQGSGLNFQDKRRCEGGGRGGENAELSSHKCTLSLFI